MTRSRNLLLSISLLVCVALPHAARAQSEAEKLTFDVSGWLLLNSYSNFGGLNRQDLPTLAIAGANERNTGGGVRQSRLRANIGLPTDGLLANAKLKGFIEADFMGSASNDTAPHPRLRHAYVTANWKDLGNLTLLVGQSWAFLEGPYFADSVSHLAFPRFAGAGQLFRRAPQVKLTGDIGKQFALLWGAGVFAPMTGEGDRSGAPNFEGRVAFAHRPAPKRGFELGVAGLYGREKHEVGASKFHQTVPTEALSLDAKIDAPFVTLKGAGFVGKNLDQWGSVVPSVRDVNVSGRLERQGVATRGYWAQAVVSPMKQFSLVAGSGLEQVREGGLTPAAGAQNVLRSRQLSGGVIVNLTSKWRMGAEYTHYTTRYQTSATAQARQQSSQVELSTLLAL